MIEIGGKTHSKNFLGQKIMKYDITKCNVIEMILYKSDVTKAIQT